MARFEMSSTIFRNQFYLAFLFRALSLVKTIAADGFIEVELNKISTENGTRHFEYTIHLANVQ